jgi:hypothetical protein
MQVMPAYELQSSTVYALYASREYLDANIAKWMTLLRDHITGIVVRRSVRNEGRSIEGNERRPVQPLAVPEIDRA